MDQARLGCFARPMAARQANRSHIANVGLFRYFVFTNCGRARNHRARTLVARISGEVQVLLFHLDPRKAQAVLHYSAPAAHHVNDKYHQRDNQQQVNQTTRDVEAETKKPQNQ